MATSEQRLADAAERIAAALEYFVARDQERSAVPAPPAPAPAPAKRAKPEPVQVGVMQPESVVPPAAAPALKKAGLME